MKRIICLLLCCISLLVFFGCAEEEPEVEQGLCLYYPVAQRSYEPGSSAIGSEARALDKQTALDQILDVYFLGPEAEHLLPIFPSELRIVRTAIEDKTVYITVSSHMAELSGLKLTIACACLTLTTLELTGAETVVINAEDALLDGQKSITMDKNNLLLTDIWQEE